MAHAEAHAAHDHAHGPNVAAYMAVFAALSVFTIISFVANSMVRSGSMSASTAFAVILGVAVIKALLVAIIFMHLKWDWGRLYFLIMPAFIVAPFMILALLPDLVIYWKNFYQATGQ